MKLTTIESLLANRPGPERPNHQPSLCPSSARGSTSPNPRRYFFGCVVAALLSMATAQAQFAGPPKKPTIDSPCEVTARGEFGSKQTVAKTKGSPGDLTRSRVTGTLRVFGDKWVMIETKKGWQVWIPREAMLSIRTKRAAE
jgi:hypothetical protein